MKPLASGGEAFAECPSNYGKHWRAVAGSWWVWCTGPTSLPGDPEDLAAKVGLTHPAGACPDAVRASSFKLSTRLSRVPNVDGDLWKGRAHAKAPSLQEALLLAKASDWALIGQLKATGVASPAAKSSGKLWTSRVMGRTTVTVENTPLESGVVNLRRLLFIAGLHPPEKPDNEGKSLNQFK